MDNDKLLNAAIELIKTMDQTVDESLPRDIADIVKFHSKGAAIAGLASGWLPGVGAIAAVSISGGFIWTMYGRINGKIDLPLSENIIKTLASGIATNVAAYAAISIGLGTVFSLFPGLGSVASATIEGCTCYALTLASGFVYLKLLTRVFKTGKDPSSISEEALKKVAKTVIQNEDIKAVMKDAKEAYNIAKESGELDKHSDNDSVSMTAVRYQDKKDKAKVELAEEEEKEDLQTVADAFEKEKSNKRWKQCLPLISKLFAAKPDEPVLCTEMAYVTRRVSGPADARKIILEYLKKHGGHPQLLFNLACYECLLGHNKLALDQIKTLKTMDPSMLDNALADSDLAPIHDKIALLIK